MSRYRNPNKHSAPSCYRPTLERLEGRLVPGDALHALFAFSSTPVEPIFNGADNLDYVPQSMDVPERDFCGKDEDVPQLVEG
jgi:hypothetical protein